MSDAWDGPVLHAQLNDYIVADGDVEEPTAGAVLRGLALRLIPRRTRALATSEVVDGAVEWARYDEDNQFFESVVNAGRFRLLTQVEGRGPGWSIGSSVRVEGFLVSVGPYEFEAFGLPDVRQDWFVVSTQKDASGSDYALEIRPLS